MKRDLPAQPSLEQELKEHVDFLALESGGAIEQLKRAFMEDDAVRFGKLLERHPELKARINEPVSDFGAPVITAARSRAMLDVLLAAGADINAKSRWWAGGFGLLHCGDPSLASYAIERGAVVDVHAAARLGMFERLRELVSKDPSLVHARGGDGQTPLHFARTVEIAEYLLEQGADIDARDVDHESTPQTQREVVTRAIVKPPDRKVNRAGGRRRAHFGFFQILHMS